MTGKTDMETYLEELDGKTPAAGSDEPGTEVIETQEDNGGDPPPDPEEDITPVHVEKYTKGKFKSVEEIDNHFSEYEGLKEKTSTLEAQIAELKKVTSANPLEDDAEYLTYKNLSRIFNTKDHSMLDRINPESLNAMSDLEVIKLKSVLDDPDYKGKESILDRSLKRMYKVELPSDYDDMTPEEKKEADLEVEEAQFKLSKDAKKAREELNTKRQEAIKEIPKKKSAEEVDADTKKRVETLQKDWTKPLQEEVLPAMSKFSYKEGEEIIEVPIPESLKEAKNAIMAQVIDIIYANDLKPTKELIEDMRVRAYKTFIGENHEVIMAEVAKSAAGIARKMEASKWQTSTWNSSALKTPAKGVAGKSGKTDQENYMSETGL